jgi:hypothetical protein
MLDHLRNLPTLSIPDGDHSSPYQLRRFLPLILTSRTRLVPERRKANSTIDQQHLPGHVSLRPLTHPRARPQYLPTSALENVPVPFPTLRTAASSGLEIHGQSR